MHPTAICHIRIIGSVAAAAVFRQRATSCQIDRIDRRENSIPIDFGMNLGHFEAIATGIDAV